MSKKVILYGLACVGKSTSIMDILNIPSVGKVIYLVTDRNALSGIEFGLTYHKVKLEKDKLFISIIERKGKGNTFSNEIEALTKFSSQSSSEAQSNDKTNMSKDKYTYYIDVLNGLNNFKGYDYVTKEVANLGDVGSLQENDVLVIDGLTPITVAIWELVKGSRVVPTISDYGTVQSRLQVLTYNLCKLRCNVVLLAHADRIKDDIENIEKLRIALNAGSALAASYGSSFDDVIYAYQNNKGYFWAGKKAGVETAARSFPSQDELEPKFSKYSFF